MNRVTVESEYGWETLLSNVLIARVLSLWVVAMFALARAYYIGAGDWHSVGLGWATSRTHQASSYYRCSCFRGCEWFCS